MACNTLNGIAKACENNIGGISVVYLIDEDSITVVNNGPTSSYFVDSISGTSSNLPKQYTFKRYSSNYTEEAGIDTIAGSTFYNATLNLVFTKREAAKSKEVMILGEGQRYLSALVLDGNGNYWLLRDLQVTAVGEGSGTAKADGSKYTVTLLGMNNELARQVATADAATFISTGSFT